ncbi:hypothetical protein ACXYMO_05380 [Arenibacterium sp. CAU 1754]
MTIVALSLIVLIGLPLAAQLFAGRVHLLYWSGAAALFLVNLITLVPGARMGHRSIMLSQADGAGGFHTTRYVLSQGYFSTSMDIGLFCLGLIVLALQKRGALYYPRMTQAVFWGFYVAAVIPQLGVYTLMRRGEALHRFTEFAGKLAQYEKISAFSLVLIYLSMIVFVALLVLSLLRRFNLKN